MNDSMQSSIPDLDIGRDRELLRVLCLKSYWYFINVVILQALPNTKDNPRFELRPFHRDMADYISDLSIKRKGILFPRYFGKTTFGTQPLPIWLWLNNHESRILIVAETHDKAKGFMNAIKAQIDNNVILHYLFPETVIDKEYKRTHRWSSEEVDLPRDGIYPAPTLKCMGVGGAAQGYHGTDIIIDDLIGKNAMMSETIRRDVEIWFNNVTELLVSPDHSKPHGSRLTIIGTHYAPGDIYHKIQQTRPEFEWMKVPAEDEYGQPTWPEVLSAEEIARMKSNPDELVKFYTQMQNDPIKTDLADFKAPWLEGQYWEHVKDEDGNPGYTYTCKTWKDGGYEYTNRFVLPKDLQMRGVIDPAVSEGGIRKTARTAIVIVGTDTETDRHLIIEAWAKRIGQPRELYNQVFEFHEKYNVRSWGIETFAQQNFILKALREEGVARGKFLPITELPKDVGQNAKDIRIRALQDEFATGKIFLNQMRHTDLIAEYLSFPMGSTKDLLDALGYHKLFWNKPPSEESLKRGKQRSQKFKTGRSRITGY